MNLNEINKERGTKEISEMIFGECREELLNVAKEVLWNSVFAETVFKAITNLFKTDEMKFWYSDSETMTNALIVEYLELCELIEQWEKKPDAEMWQVIEGIFTDGKDFARRSFEKLSGYMGKPALES